MSLLAGLRQALPPIIELLSFLMLLMAIGISTVKTMRRMIPLYQLQSVILAVTTFFKAIEPDVFRASNQLIFVFNQLIFMPLVILPIFLAVSVEPLLAQATVPEDFPVLIRLRRLLSRDIRIETRRRAIPIWLEQPRSRLGEVTSLAYSLILVLIAYATAFFFVGRNIDQASSLAVPVSLLLLGLFTMGNKQALISQIMGLLVMEHGLFLAAVKVIPIPSVAIIFVISLFLYIIITLMILLFLLPELHHSSGSIQVKDQQELEG